MSGGQDPSHPPYAVGYGKPPAEHRFQKGRSGNPGGRPPKRYRPTKPDLSFGGEAAKAMLLDEAYRVVTVREGDRTFKLPAVQAVIRSISVKAMKGDRHAQRQFAEMVQAAEAADRKLRNEHLETAIQYKRDWEEAIQAVRQRGLPEPTPLPHPDDVIVDLTKGEIVYAGPRTTEEKREWDRIVSRRDEAQRLISEAAAAYRKSRSARTRERWLDEWHFEQRIFDAINDQLPTRYRTVLADRSYAEGASQANPTHRW